MASEHWDILNIPSRFGCHKRACQRAERISAEKRAGFIVRHHGRRPAAPNQDPHRVNHFVYSKEADAEASRGGDPNLIRIGKWVYRRDPVLGYLDIG